MERYTTLDLIAKDSKGIESEKTIISNDVYAISEFICELINKIEHTRVSLMK